MSRYKPVLIHHGILGMHWGVRRFRNKDGSLTTAGKQRYAESDGMLNQKGQPIYTKESITNRGTLNDYYNRSVPVVEGLYMDDVNQVKKAIDRFNSIGIDTRNLEIRNISGQTMNKTYGLKGQNAYRPNFNIMVFDGLDKDSVRKLRTSFGGVRYYDDVVDNNTDRN